VKSTRPGRRPGPYRDHLAGRYALGEAIGQGRSTVYRGEDLRLRRHVAVKQIRLDMSPEPGDTRARAMREAQAAARLSNPRAVTVFDVVEERGSIWLVMELVDVPSLAELVANQGRLAHRRAATIGIDVLDALRAAHAVGVVHRDVKPANVLVEAGDRAKLTDFGVARVRDDAKLTATGHIIGSPAYMAPEQARGDPVGPSADLWALGATLYFAVEGVSPFPGTSPIAVATAVVHGQRRQPSRPGPLTDIIDRLLSKEPGQRPRAGQVRRALRGARRSQPLDRTPPVPPPLDSTAAGARAVGLDDTSSSSGNADQTEVFPILTAPPSGASEGGDASNPNTGRGHAGDVATGPAAEQPSAGHNVSSATACNPAVSQDQGVAEPVATVPDVSVTDAGHTTAVTCVSSELNDGKRHTGEAPTTRAFSRDEGANAAAPTVREPGDTGANAAAPTVREPGDTGANAAAPTAREPGNTGANAAAPMARELGNTVAADADEVVTTRDVACSGASGEAGESHTTTGMGVHVTVRAPVLNGAGKRRREALGPPLTNRRPRPERKALGISGGRGVRLVMLVGGALGGLAILALAVLPTSETGRNGDSDRGADNKAATETTADTGGDAATAADHTAAPTTATTIVRTTNPTATTRTTDIGAAQARASSAGPQVPNGWIVFAEPEGAYSIAHPPGWEVALGSRAHTVFIREPGTGTYLLVEWTPDPKPDPVADWEEQSKYFANRHEGYEQLRIEPFPYRDYNAAMWEFRYRAEGTVLHAGNLNIVTAGRAYALYFQTREQRWHASQDTFTQFRQAFNPAP
jgi:eukaryotic-like serine/threonine-protein kinase